MPFVYVKTCLHIKRRINFWYIKAHKNVSEEEKKGALFFLVMFCGLYSLELELELSLINVVDLPNQSPQKTN